MLQSAINAVVQHEIRRIPIQAIRLNPALMVRRFYDDATLGELELSFAQQGQIYPVIVRAIEDVPNAFELFAGTRRFKAAERLKVEDIPAVVMSKVSDQRALEIALSENLQREDLTPFEEAWVILRLTKEYKQGMGEVAKCLGKSEQFVRRRLQLLSLPQEIQELIADRKLSLAQVETLVSVKSPSERVKLAQSVAKHSLSDGELVTLIRERTKGKGALKEKAERRPQHLSGIRLALQIKQFSMRLESMHSLLPTLQPSEAREVEAALAELEVKIREARDKMLKCNY